MADGVLSDPQQSAQAITPFFEGTTTIGEWTLKCSTSDEPKTKDPNSVNFRRCLASLIVRANSKDTPVALVAVVRLIQNSDDVAMILHVPPMTDTTSLVQVALTDDQMVSLPVIQCDKNNCMALGVLKPDVYNAMLDRPRLAVIIPNGAGQDSNMIVPLPLFGLSEAIRAMRHVQE